MWDVMGEGGRVDPRNSERDLVLEASRWMWKKSETEGSQDHKVCTWKGREGDRLMTRHTYTCTNITFIAAMPLTNFDCNG